MTCYFDALDGSVASKNACRNDGAQASEASKQTLPGAMPEIVHLTKFAPTCCRNLQSNSGKVAGAGAGSTDAISASVLRGIQRLIRKTYQ